MSPEPLPLGWRLRADPATRIARDGRTVVGGVPLRVLRLRPAGAAAVGRWFAGGAVDGGAERVLARRLCDAGVAHPVPVPGGEPASLTVVVPVRDRPDQLRRCLASIPTACPVLVVDDGSADAAAVARAASDHGAALLRLAVNGGPSRARNAGLAEVQTPFVAFVDSDCVLAPGFPGVLLDHLADPAVGAVAPRVAPLEAGTTPIGRYEARHSALDMGSRPGLVAPGAVVPYLPSAALLVRREALDGFDEGLTIGEDVDVVWRMHRAGWQVRYVPEAAVLHDHRATVRRWFARRVTYGTSNAALELRHPGAVPALRLGAYEAAFWAALVAGRPAASAAVGLVASGKVARRLRGGTDHPRRLAGALVVRGHLQQTRHVARALSGPWLPATLLAGAVAPGLGRRLGAVLAVGLCLEWAEERREPTPLHLVGPRLLDDLARCVGVLRGCAQQRTLRPLALRIR